ncbi:argininosuccinate lyase [Collinsella tanakaei]|uniref:argininosuccinate lyase n=1 Tax=Collinsella tanakaei TaxID=626935 RepID=UPI0025A44890|nr:argininosuccinate lyase [Collinsella tanakaei]MDM8299897.1 argininosuccinate lyase [Collinsella tanakaei]
MALWGGRFEESVSELTQEFGASLPVDRHLYRQDIAGSKAHAAMLAAQGIISAEDARAIHDGLDAIQADIDAGAFTFDINDEDIHMAIESELTRRIGAAGGRLHTGRSRNDQVATDTRLAAKALSASLMEGNLALRHTLVEAAAAAGDTILPGMTHLQHAQPVLFAHHLLAYAWMLARDFTRLRAAFDAADASPLGAAALAGTTYPLDRQMTADALGFSRVIENSLDAVSDRDFLLDLEYACSVMAVHLSRLSEEIVLWSSQEFGFITLSDAYSTGSSIMPQKKNPDFAELIRGKSGRVVGDLVQLLVTVKGLPLAYNKDLQEDKESALDAARTLEQCLSVMCGMVGTWTVNADRMRAVMHRGHLAATDVADYLAKRGMPFREAHAVVGHLVLEAERAGCDISELPVDTFKAASELFGDDVVGAFDLDAIVAARTTQGGTAPVAVAAQMEKVKAGIAADEAAVAALSPVVEMGAGTRSVL